MPDMILRILSIIGIIILILLGLVLILLLLLLFWPVTYRVKGEKYPDKLWIAARADWLFGLFRVRYAYPEPGTVVIKLLWKTLVDTGQKKNASKGKEEAEAQEENSVSTEKTGGDGSTGEEDQSARAGDSVSAEKAGEDGTTGEMKQSVHSGDSASAEAAQGEPETAETTADAGAEAFETTADAEEQAQNTPFSSILEKIQKIKYTILKIYDKIKEIWANISYYIALLREEDTALLWEHVKLRLGKILKSIRPRHIRANVLYGAGSPDTTGYVFGIYSMLLPVLGRNVCVTPDFNQAVLEGNVDVSGHITLGILVWNALKLLLDRKLKMFIKKMKAGRKENGR